MFADDPRQGSPTLYVREHFDLRRVCGNCGRRVNLKRFAVSSLILEGDTWVLPISVGHDGRILIDLEASIPDQSNFLCDRVIEGLSTIGIDCVTTGLEYIVPIAADRAEYFGNLRKNKYWDYKNVRKHFECKVATDASPDDILKWDTEVEYDFEEYWHEKSGERRCGYSVETEYFQWLAEHGRLVVARISDSADVTLALAHCVPGDFELFLVNPKRRTEHQYSKYGLGNALIFMLLDYIFENELLTPLNLGSILYQYKEVWRPVPVLKPQLAFASVGARDAILDRFSAA